jgi:hypothetical protein
VSTPCEPEEGRELGVHSYRGISGAMCKTALQASQPMSTRHLADAVLRT